ncbi:protein arginine kinase activator [Verrucomicrobium sp. GAS474]|uniref:UvrB/UvrC motif-containing protein n=1 Tax=Verrucomicrobium sp. GAS474 TaxID=1882831 RepID=UPI00087D61D9|nr:UvrB/UvrC motif-containing protein [Verrucomicrobium sp. GAS474]SDU24284.1 protein arginine kinase activator [Verrucomicrobium sp. GAS474]
MLKCQFCTETATVHLTQIVGGKMQKIDLCEKCAKEKGVSDPAGFSLADMLLGLGAADQIKTATPDELICPQCGFTQPDFKKTGRLGCAACYETFNEGLATILKDMHKGTSHKGKAPTRFAKQRIFADQMRDLRKDLQKAITEEKYEEAASLRDKISQLESQLK